MGLLLEVFLPLSLAFIMFSLGLGLTVSDFTRAFKMPKAFLIGACSQLIVLPITAYVLVIAFGMTGPLAVGVMILAFSPGGVTSNILTRFANGALALSISLTAIISVLSVITVPLLLGYFSNLLMGEQAPSINVLGLGLSMALLTAVPVGLGVLIRHLAPAGAERIEPKTNIVATVLFGIILVGAIASNWALFTQNFATLGPLVILLNAILLCFGFILAKLAKLERREAVAIAIETGVQNASLGITVGSLIVEASQGLPPFSLPSGVYGLTMYAVTMPFVLWARSWTKAETKN